MKRSHWLAHQLASQLPYVLLSVLLLLTGLWLRLLQQGGWLLPVRAAGMAPVIPPNAAVVIQPMSKPRVGDIIAYCSSADGSVKVSRVVRIAGGQLTVRDDKSIFPAAPLTADQLIGRVNIVLPHLGGVLGWLTDKTHLLVAIYLPAGAITGLEVKRLGRQLYPKPYLFNR